MFDLESRLGVDFMSTHLKASSMVAQEKPLKTSSNRRPPPTGYEIHAILSYDWLLPSSVELVKIDPDSYTVSGRLGSKRVDAARWAGSPHTALANLPISPSSETGLGPRVDPRAAQRFIQNYGVLKGAVVDHATAERLKSQPAFLAAQATAPGPVILSFGGVTDFTAPFFAVSDAEFAEA